MSGSSSRGSRSYRGGNSGGVVDTISCEDLSFETFLNSPVPAVLATVIVNECLEIGLHQSGTVRVAVAKKAGSIVGTVTSADLGKLIECLAKGHPFRGLVLEVSKGLCKVLVQSGKCP